MTSEIRSHLSTQSAELGTVDAENKRLFDHETKAATQLDEVLGDTDEYSDSDPFVLQDIVTADTELNAAKKASDSFAAAHQTELMELARTEQAKRDRSANVAKAAVYWAARNK